MNNKIKVVLLSQYWSDEMAEMVGRKHYFRELAPWIQETINLFKGKDDIELHVVAPNYASNLDVNAFRDNIHYHYFHYSPRWLSVLIAPLIKRLYNYAEVYKLAERIANVLTGFRVPAWRAARIIRKINPDLIHLYGSEFPDQASSAAILIKEYPLLLSVQGFAFRMELRRNPFDYMLYWYRAHYEKIINTKVKYKTVPRKMNLSEVALKEKHFFEEVEKIYYQTVITKVPQIDALHTQKKYDAAFYARITASKGVEDLINAVEYMRNNGRGLRVVIMGRGDDAYVEHLRSVIVKKNMDDLIEMVGFVEDHEEVYKIASQSRLLVLPTHKDGLPNTVREAMFMHLPIVANNVGGIPRFNEHRHCIHLVELGDIEGLANGICKVLDDDDYRKELIDNSYQEAWEYYSPDAIYEQTIFAYKDIVSQFKNNPN